MSAFKQGDRVKIADREMTAADSKSGLFYDYFRGLKGTVDRIYDDKTVCVQVDPGSLPEDVAKRHTQIEESVRTRWINGLSAEQRERLSESEKTVTLAYNILIGETDLQPLGKESPRARAATPPKKAEQPEIPHRPTQAEIDKQEEEYLKTIAARATEKHVDG